MKIARIHFDGGFGNGFGTIGFTVVCENKSFQGTGKIEDARMTSNIAEYIALLKAIKATKKMIPDVGYLEIFGDSKLVVMHVSKKWGYAKNKTWQPHSKYPYLETMLMKVLSELEGMNYSINWIPREQNEKADELSRVKR